MDGRMDGWVDPILLNILGYCQVSSDEDYSIDTA